MKALFKKIIVDFSERNITGILPREYAIPLKSEKIISLIGVRRSGKSSILFGLINQLREQIDNNKIVYINFEDDRLYPLTLKDLDMLLEAYFELYPANRDQEIYLFLDEVQVVDNWELYVRRIYDTLNIHIYITGSSAKLLSTEISTSLRGRAITYEIFPFSFKEYLQYKDIEFNQHSSKSISFVENALESYLIDGGFAETINQDSEISRKILSDYLELIVYKDIVERYNIKNRGLLKILNKYCFTNIATLLNVTKLFNELKGQGYKLGKDTLFEYLSHLEDAYTVFTVPIYRNSIKEEQRNPKKIYAIDNGFKKIYDYAISDDASKLYENIVFLHLRRQTKQVYYFKQKQEVDFYVKLTSGIKIINVSYQIDNKDTRDREINGLIEAMEYFNIDHSYLVTKDEDQELAIGEKIIYIMPLYKFLLAPNQQS